MSKEQSPPVREVVPYKSGKRVSTFRKLNIDFGGTALEQAIAQQQQFETETSAEIETNQQIEVSNIQDHSPPLTTSHHQSPPVVDNNNITQQNEQLKTIDAIQEVQPKTTHHHSPPLTTTHQFQRVSQFEKAAPDRDFNKRANSIERDALPSGTFPGSTKKVYDALYLRTRGAISPARVVSASRRDLLDWTGIRNIKTIDNHIRYLMAKGLIVRHWERGSNEGSQYEVVLPEEVLEASQPLSTSGGHSPLTTSHQKTGSGYTQFLGSGGDSQLIEDKGTYDFPKTIKTIDDDITHTLRGFVAALGAAAKEVCGGVFQSGEQEKARWDELAAILVQELKMAAGNTNSVSSAPAFYAAHLRRRFARYDNEESPRRQNAAPEKRPTAVPPAERRAPRKEEGEEKSRAEGNTRYSFNDRLAYAEAQTPKLGPGWLKESQKGSYDELIGHWKSQQAAERRNANVDVTRCPDCQGSGMYYPGGYEKGAAKCKHEKLREAMDEIIASSDR